MVDVPEVSKVPVVNCKAPRGRLTALRGLPGLFRLRRSTPVM
jgi:hypothetical protein